MKLRHFLPLFIASPTFAQSPNLMPKSLDEMVITASPMDRSLFELVQPASILKDKNLLLNLQPTLGETLDLLPGVSSTSFGPGASRPIIRGLGDDRLRILQNGTSVIDVSNVSPDHAVAVDPLTVSLIEVVRGPATLLYGPNTVGGVVNTIDERIPEERISGINGSLDSRFGTTDNLRSFGGAVNFGAGPFVFHLDAFSRRADNLEIPGFARSKQLRDADPNADEAFGTLPNSFSESDGASIGSSYIWDKGFIGISYSGIDSLYGTVAEENVTIDLRQRRWDLRGAVREPAAGIREINFKFGYTDYEHTEFEGIEVGTQFLADGFNTRAELKHEKISEFEGAVGFEIQRNDFEALGAEAFVPAVENQTNSLFIFEEIALNPFMLQFGGRYDYQSNKTDAIDRDFNAFSISAGAVYNPTEDYAIALSLGYSKRPPNYVELFANGAHVATNTIEIGDSSLGTEDSLALDLSFRKKTGRVTGSISGFYYRFNDFVSLQNSGLPADAEGLLTFNYEAVGADFYGGEIETTFHLLEPKSAPSNDDKTPDQQLDLILRADYVRAENRDSNEPIPRIPPFRATIGLDYQLEKFGANLDAQWSANQNRVAADELPTDGYVLVSLGFDYRLTIGEVNTTFFLKGTNLLDQDARQSTSFLKDVAPIAGRGLIAGFRSEF